MTDLSKDEEQETELIDYVLPGLACVFMLCCFAVAVCLLVGGSVFAAFISLFCLIISIPFFGLYISQRTQFLRAREKSVNNAKRLNEAIDQLVEYGNAFKGLKTNFDNLLADEIQEVHRNIQDKKYEAARLLEEARDNVNAVDRLGKRFLADSVKWVSQKLTPNNFTNSKERLQKVIEFCRKQGYEVTKQHEKELHVDLRDQFEKAVRAAFEKEEQARIKAQIREEQRAEREIQKELERVDAERNAIEKALEKALRDAADDHSAEVDALREKLREAEERAERAVSMAQKTKSGFVYVISNIGSFGSDVFKVGMTRRLEPMDRVKELSDASVPFPFDVHMMISCDDAPSLENELHRTLHDRRVNKVNLRKEFFRTDVESIKRVVEEHHGTVEYVADPEALEYYETLDMDENEFATITETMEAVMTELDEEA